MATVDTTRVTARVQRQYDAFPYPPRNPAEEDTRLIANSSDDLTTVNFRCFAGRKDYGQNFRVLVAGGGTGDATVFLAYQLRNTSAEIVHLDISRSALEIAQQRIERRGLSDRVSWVCGSLLDLPERSLGSFDYINCVGVLHHLDNPDEGLAALRSVLKPDGAMSLMVYGQYGRTGVYAMQNLMRLVNDGESSQIQSICNARQTLEDLPKTNWFQRGIDLFENPEFDDAELLDMFLHNQDRSYTVPELYDYVEQAELEILDFVTDHRPLYQPEFVLKDPNLLQKIATRPLRVQQAIAELAGGTINRHSFWAAPTPRSIESNLGDYVPLWSFYAQCQGFALSSLSSSDSVWNIHLDRGEHSLEIPIELTTIARYFFQRIDNQQTFAMIVQQIDRELPQHSSQEIWNECLRIFKSLAAHDMMVLRHKSVLPLLF